MELKRRSDESIKPGGITILKKAGNKKKTISRCWWRIGETVVDVGEHKPFLALIKKNILK